MTNDAAATLYPHSTPAEMAARLGSMEAVDEAVTGASFALDAAEGAIARGDVTAAGSALAAAMARLDGIDDGEGNPTRIASRILGAVRGIRAIFEGQLSAAVEAEGRVMAEEDAAAILTS